MAKDNEKVKNNRPIAEAKTDEKVPAKVKEYFTHNQGVEVLHFTTAKDGSIDLGFKNLSDAKVRQVRIYEKGTVQTIKAEDVK